MPFIRGRITLVFLVWGLAGALPLLARQPDTGFLNRTAVVGGATYKYLDVVLLFARDFEIIPVDTHVFRVSRRIGLAQQKGGYGAVKIALEDEIPPVKRKFAHIALIRLGREICVARGPQHWKCPLTDLCDYYQATSCGANNTS